MEKPERKAFHEQVQRIEEYLTEDPPTTRGLVVFASPNVWQVIALRVDTIDELFRGLPSVSQLLWLIEEHRHCGVVLADRTGVRLFHYWMAELTKEHREVTEDGHFRMEKKRSQASFPARRSAEIVSKKSVANEPYYHPTFCELNCPLITRKGWRYGRESGAIAGGCAGGGGSSTNVWCFRRLVERYYGLDSREERDSVDSCET
jgi:hypothetical protein